MYYNKSLTKYTNDMAARKPAPGGGSSAAFVACLAASLLSKVINFSLGKTQYAQYGKYLKSTLKKTEALRRRFMALADLDALAFQSRDMKKAASVPLQVCDLSLTGIKLCPELTKKGNRNLITDVAVAAVLFEAACTSAAYNVEINLKSLAPSSSVNRIKTKLSRQQQRIKDIRLHTEARIGKIIRR